MNRTITDSRGREWQCELISLLPEEAVHSLPGSPLTEVADASLRCACGDQRVLIRAPMDWDQMPESDLRDLLERKLRERGHA